MHDGAIHPLEEQAAVAADLLSALANARRLTLLCLLLDRELSVGELAERVGLSQSALSQHLTRLRSQGIVAARPSGRHIYYSVAHPVVRDVIATLCRHYGPAG